MKKNISILICLFFSVLTLYAQRNDTDEHAKSAIKKLNFIVGSWAGTGMILGKDGNKHEFLN